MDKLKTITKWLADYLKDNGKTTFVINFNGSREDGLLTYVCSEACKGTGTNVLVYSDYYVENILKQIYFGTSNVRNLDKNSFIDALENAGMCNGVVVGSVEKTFGKYYRTYHKNCEFLADIFPFYDFSYSDIVELTCDIFGCEIEWLDSWEVERYQIVEWANSMEDKYGILTSKESPSRHDQWKYFTQDQKTMIAFMHARQHKTLHKIINKPYPKLES